MHLWIYRDTRYSFSLICPTKEHTLKIPITKRKVNNAGWLKINGSELAFIKVLNIIKTEVAKLFIVNSTTTFGVRSCNLKFHQHRKTIYIYILRGKGLSQKGPSPKRSSHETLGPKTKPSRKGLLAPISDIPMRSSQGSAAY